MAAVSMSVPYNNYAKANQTTAASSKINYSAYSKISDEVMSKYGKNNAVPLSQKKQDFVAQASKESDQLSKALNSLMNKGKKDEGVFKKQVATSSNTEVMSITSTDAKQAIDEKMKVTVDQVATTQKNEGVAMASSAQNESSGQYYKFEIETGGKKHQISFTTTSKDTNATFQQKMADAINKQNIGVTATVATEAKAKTSALSLESKTSGTDAKTAFTIKDVTGNATSKAKVQEVTQVAQDAAYKVNGEAKTSKTNDVDLGNGVKATLKKASTEEVSIVKGKDNLAALNKTREMVNAYNGLVEASQNNSSDKKSRRLETELSAIAKTYGSTLNAIGISMTSDGYMTIDEKKMKTASENGQLEKAFNKDGNTASYGMANRLSRTADKVTKDTLAYVTPEKSVAKQASQSGFDMSYFNQSQITKVNQFTNMGLLFDSMF